jgi:sec-independent protein translocase protein TatC
MAGELYMGFLEHLDELRKRFLICIVATIIIMAFVLTLVIEKGEVGGITVYYPWWDYPNNVAAQLFEQFKADLLPDNVVLLNIKGIDALLVDIKIGIFLSIALATPIIAWQMSKFILPALYPRERRFIAKIVLPATGLFILGALFSYYVFTPFAMDFFFSFSEELEVGIPDPQGNIQPTIGVSEFLGWIIMMTLAFGLIFELPIFMGGISFLGLISWRTWLGGWRYAMVAFLVIGGIITPDASGVTQILVAIPMFGLYMLGVGLSYIAETREERKEKRAAKRAAKET